MNLTRKTFFRADIHVSDESIQSKVSKLVNIGDLIEIHFSTQYSSRSDCLLLLFLLLLCLKMVSLTKNSLPGSKRNLFWMCFLSYIRKSENCWFLISTNRRIPSFVSIFLLLLLKSVNLTKNTFFRILWRKWPRNNRRDFESFQNMQNYSCQM